MAFWNMYLSLQAATNCLMTELGMYVKLSPHVGDSLVSRARNNCLADFLQSDSQYFLTLDDDISLPERGMVQLIEADKDMVGGIYRLKKDVEPDPNVNPFAVRWSSEIEDLNHPAEVDYLSSGCVLHKRKFIQEMVAHYPELEYKENVTGNQRWALYQPYVYNNEYLSEDWAFMQRAKDKGYKIWIHGGVRCDHFGIANFGFDKYFNERNLYDTYTELTGEIWGQKQD
jgi:hypothetical protein